MTNKIKKWIKELLFIVQWHRQQHNDLLKRMTSLEKYVSDRTNVSMDVVHNGSVDSIIVIGTYKNHDYVRVFNCSNQDFIGIIEHLRAQERYHRINKIDAPIGFKAVFQRELDY